MVTSNQLAEMAIQLSGKDIKINNIEGQKFLDKYGFKCPVGVRGRNSDNKLYNKNQLKKLTANNQKRVENFSYFLSKLDESKYYSRFDLIGSCNYAFVIIFEKNFRNKVFRKKFETILQNNKIEFRRGTAGGGNQTLQPYLSSFKKNYKITKNLTNTNIIHDYGYYIGNYPNLKRRKILEICQILNSI